MSPVRNRTHCFFVSGTENRLLRIVSAAEHAGLSDRKETEAAQQELETLREQKKKLKKEKKALEKQLSGSGDQEDGADE